MCTSCCLWNVSVARIPHYEIPGSPCTKKRPINNRMTTCYPIGLFYASIGCDAMWLLVYSTSCVKPVFLKKFDSKHFGIFLATFIPYPPASKGGSSVCLQGKMKPSPSVVKEKPSANYLTFSCPIFLFFPLWSIIRQLSTLFSQSDERRGLSGKK